MANSKKNKGNNKSQKSGAGPTGNNNSGGSKGSGGGQQQKGLGTGKGGTASASNTSVSISTRFNIVNSGDSGDIICSGTEIVGMVQMGTISNGIVFVSDLNPTTWVGTRLASMARLFERFLFHEVKITYVPTCSATTGGLMYMYYDRDPLDAPIPGIYTAASISRLMSNQAAVVGQVWKPVAMNFKKSAGDESSYFMSPTLDGADIRNTSQGIVYAYTNAAIGSITGGLFKFDYRVRLFTPTGAIAANVNYTPEWKFDSYSSPQETVAANPIVPVIPLLVAAGDVITGAVFKVLVDKTIHATIGTFRGTAFEPYTPLFFRVISAGVLRAFTSYDGAVNNTPSLMLTGISANSSVNGNAFFRLLSSNVANIASNQ